MSPEIRISYELTELIESASVLKGIKAKAVAGSPLALLMGEATKRGYQPVTGPKNVLGYRHTMKADQEVKPPRGVTAESVKEVTFELHVQDHIKPRSKDVAAVATVTIRAGKNIDTYHMLLEAPGGNFAAAKEWTVKDGEVILAKSWWTAVVKCLKERCVSVCIGALVSCPTTSWSAYLACVAVKCGPCWVKCIACATCNCKWWCKWAVGCCKQ